MSVFAASQELHLFSSTTKRYLETHYPVARVRQLAGEDTTFDAAVWREGAELGWTSLLVPEAAGGGSISGNGLADLLPVAALFGSHAAPGPLIGTNVVAAALGRWGSPTQHAGPLVELVAGEAVAAWAHHAEVVVEGGVLRGRATAVESAADARYVLVGGHLVPMDSPGVSIGALRSVDLTRRFADVTFDGVPVSADTSVAVDDDLLLDIVAVLATAEITGALHRSFELTMDWLANRYSFGRPLASYQEIKHRVADLRTQLEACEAVAAKAAVAVWTESENARQWASAALAYAARFGPEAIQDCVQLHGGIGVTYDHDLHLYLRRATLDANLYGSHADFARRLGRLVAA